MNALLLFLVLFPAPKDLPPLPQEVLPIGTLLIAGDVKSENVYVVLRYEHRDGGASVYEVEMVQSNGKILPPGDGYKTVTSARNLDCWTRIERPEKTKP